MNSVKITIITRGGASILLNLSPKQANATIAAFARFNKTKSLNERYLHLEAIVEETQQATLLTVIDLDDVSLMHISP